jgi:hypothetical protein
MLMLLMLHAGKLIPDKPAGEAATVDKRALSRADDEDGKFPPTADAPPIPCSEEEIRLSCAARFELPV